MFTKRRIRFSIGAMLVVMAAVAVLLNHEVQRARAIGATVKKIEEWDGMVEFRRRAYMPMMLVNVLSQYWTQEIDLVVIEVDIRRTDTRELGRLIELGALDNLKGAGLCGPAFNHAAVSRLCKSGSLVTCIIKGAMISEKEFDDLKRTFPNCTFEVTEPPRYFSEAWSESI